MVAPLFYNTYLGVQQCFGVVYHELTMLRRAYFVRTALAARAKQTVLALLIHDIPRRIHC